MIVADRIGVMDRGRLMQVAPPAEIYERPNSRWVADFIGDVNVFEGRVGDDGMSVEGTAAGRLRLAAADRRRTAHAGLGRGAARSASRIVAREVRRTDAENCLAGTVVEIGYLGDLSIYKVRLADGSRVKAARRQYRAQRRCRAGRRATACG